MSMLAERKRKTQYILYPKKKRLWEDKSSGINFGKTLMEKMGWDKGKGLGSQLQGICEPLTVQYKQDSKGMGYKGEDGNWIQNQDEFNELLTSLANSTSDETEVLRKDSDNSNMQSLELKSKFSKARVHYQKFTRGKDLARYSKVDLACILGTTKLKEEDETTKNNSTNDVKEDSDLKEDEKVDTSFGVTTVHGGSIADYFKQKFKSLKRSNYTVNNDSLNNSENTFVGLGYNRVDSEEFEKTSVSDLSDNTTNPSKKRRKSVTFDMSQNTVQEYNHRYSDLDSSINNYDADLNDDRTREKETEAEEKAENKQSTDPSEEDVSRKRKKKKKKKEKDLVETLEEDKQANNLDEFESCTVNHRKTKKRKHKEVCEAEESSFADSVKNENKKFKSTESSKLSGDDTVLKDERQLKKKKKKREVLEIKGAKFTSEDNSQHEEQHLESKRKTKHKHNLHNAVEFEKDCDSVQNEDEQTDKEKQSTLSNDCNERYQSSLESYGDHEGTVYPPKKKKKSRKKENLISNYDNSTEVDVVEQYSKHKKKAKKDETLGENENTCKSYAPHESKQNEGEDTEDNKRKSNKKKRKEKELTDNERTEEDACDQTEENKTKTKHKDKKKKSKIDSGELVDENDKGRSKADDQVAAGEAAQIPNTRFNGLRSFVEMSASRYSKTRGVYDCISNFKGSNLPGVGGYGSGNNRLKSKNGNHRWQMVSVK